MNRIVIILFVSMALFFGCNSADAPDCLKAGGSIATQEISVDPFTELEINGEFEIIITDSVAQHLVVEAPKNLIPEYAIESIEGVLKITDNNGCDWVRAYDLPVIYIASPNISRITQNGAGVIKTTNALTYPEVSLITVENSGDYKMSFDNEHVLISNNELSNFYLSGRTELFTVGFFSGDGRCECEALEAQTVSVFHRGTNDMIVNPVETLQGKILSTGDLIYINNPEEVNISLEGRGELINKSDG